MRRKRALLGLILSLRNRALTTKRREKKKKEDCGKTASLTAGKGFQHANMHAHILSTETEKKC